MADMEVDHTLELKSLVPVRDITVEGGEAVRQAHEQDLPLLQ